MTKFASAGRPLPAQALVWSARLPPDREPDPAAGLAAFSGDADGGIAIDGGSDRWAAGPLIRAAAPPPPILVQTHPGGLAFDLVFDASVASAPAGFESGLVAACTDLCNIFTSGITVTLTVGWGEIDGAPLPDGVSEGGGTGFFYTYDQVAAALRANPGSADDLTAIASLPAADPTAGGAFLVVNAEAAALGLRRGDNGTIDGEVGFGAGIAYTFDPNNRAVPGELDFIGVAEHEITHAMGRSLGSGQADYTILDLFHYASPGELQLVEGEPAFFSIDGGNTALNLFDTTSDPGDWAVGTGRDAFDAAGTIGVENPLTPTDISELNVLGYDVSPSVFTGDWETGIRLADAAAQNPATITAGGYVSNGGDALLGAAGTAWTVTNLGTIATTAGDGIHLLSGGSVTNGPGAVIAGSENGVEIDAAAGTIVNAGTIGGYGRAVLFAGGGSLLVVDPGAGFQGAVVADDGGAIELAAGDRTGALSGLGGEVAGFATVSMDAGAIWDLAGDAGTMRFTNDGTILVDAGDALVFGRLNEDPGGHGTIRLGDGADAEFAAGAARGQRLVFTDATGLLQLDRPAGFHARISHFRADDRIDLVGFGADRLDFSDGKLSLFDNGHPIATLDFIGAYAASEFVLATDGSGGTDLTLAPPAALLAQRG